MRKELFENFEKVDIEHYLRWSLMHKLQQQV
jgi:hypothetical protein